jgi:hypothetical protein
MPRYKLTFTEEERNELARTIQKGGKGYRIKHAQVLMKLEDTPDNAEWTYDRIRDAYTISHNAIADVAKRFVFEGLESALGRKKRESKPIFITGEVEAHICAIACSNPPEGRSRWTMQMIADELIRLEAVETISDTAVCEVMKKMRSSRGASTSGAFRKRAPNS